jgi:opacity protein-like surface antigen
MAGAGITRVHQLDVDKQAWTDPDMGLYPIPSVGYVTIKQQIGIGAGVALHATDNIHFQAEYFRPIFQWYKPVPATATTKNPEQSFNVVNAGVTYDF